MKSKIIWGNAGWIPYQYGFCPNRKAWNEMLKVSKRDLGPYPTNAGMTTLFQNYKTGKPVAIVTIGDVSAQSVVELLAHEAMHVWRDMRESIGEKEPSSEFEAYAMQNIVGDLLTAYQKTRSKLFR